MLCIEIYQNEKKTINRAAGEGSLAFSLEKLSPEPPSIDGNFFRVINVSKKQKKISSASGLMVMITEVGAAPQTIFACVLCHRVQPIAFHFVRLCAHTCLCARVCVCSSCVRSQFVAAKFIKYVQIATN